MIERSRELEALCRLVGQMAGDRVDNYASAGLASELVGGGGRGRVRLLSAGRRTRGEICPHSHRFDFACLVLSGWAENVEFEPCDGGEPFWASPLRPEGGGMGGYALDRAAGREVRLREGSRHYVPGEVYSMRAHEFHTVRFGPDARVLFFEGPQSRAESEVLEPLQGGRVLETFRVEPWMFER